MVQSAPPRIFSPSRRVAVRQRASHRQHRADAARYLLDDAVAEVEERIGFMRLEAGKALVFGDTNGAMGAALTRAGHILTKAESCAFDEERPYPQGGYALIVHLLTLGTVNDLPGALVHARMALAKGGLLMASFPGAGSLSRLRTIMLAADGDRPSPRMHPLVDGPAASGLLQRAGFSRQVVDGHTVPVRYSSFDALISDLRDHGLTSVLADPGPSLTKSKLTAASQAFDRLADSEGKLLESYEMLTLTAWNT